MRRKWVLVAGVGLTTCLAVTACWLTSRSARDTSLATAVRNCDAPKVATLLEAGADANVDLRAVDGYSAKEFVAGLIDILRGRRLRFHERGAPAVTFLGDVFTSGDLRLEGAAEAITVALIEHGADPNVRDGFGRQPLYYATRMRLDQAVRTLLSHGCRVNDREYMRGHTALMFARRWEAVLLLRRGADIEARDFDGCTAAFYACEFGDLNTLRALVSAGADVRVKDAEQGTLLIAACRQDHPSAEIVRYLLTQGVDASACDVNGRTASWWARDSPEIVRLLTGRYEQLRTANSDDPANVGPALDGDLNSMRRRNLERTAQEREGSLARAPGALLLAGTVSPQASTRPR